MTTHSSILAWRIPGMGKPGGLPSMGSHRVRHSWPDLAPAAYGHLECRNDLISFYFCSFLAWEAFFTRFQEKSQKVTMFLKEASLGGEVIYLLFLGQKVKLPHYTGKHQVSPSICVDACRIPFRGLVWRSVGTAFSSSSTVLKKHIWHAHDWWRRILSLPYSLSLTFIKMSFGNLQCPSVYIHHNTSCFSSFLHWCYSDDNFLCYLCPFLLDVFCDDLLFLLSYIWHIFIFILAFDIAFFFPLLIMWILVVRAMSYPHYYNLDFLIHGRQ